MNYVDRTFLPRIDLAREADFAIGALKVRPSSCEIEAGGVRQGAAAALAAKIGLERDRFSMERILS